jgi:hypothetical protein
MEVALKTPSHFEKLVVGFLLLISVAMFWGVLDVSRLDSKMTSAV